MLKAITDETATMRLMSHGFACDMPYAELARNQVRRLDGKPNALSLLEEIGMLKEVTGRKWGLPYVARPILTVIEKPFSG